MEPARSVVCGCHTAAVVVVVVVVVIVFVAVSWGECGTRAL